MPCHARSAAGMPLLCFPRECAEAASALWRRRLLREDGMAAHLLHSPQKFDVIDVTNDTLPAWPGAVKFLATSPHGSSIRCSRSRCARGRPVTLLAAAAAGKWLLWLLSALGPTDVVASLLTQPPWLPPPAATASSGAACSAAASAQVASSVPRWCWWCCCKEA